MNGNLTTLESSLYLSWLLAKAHRAATPHLPLSWNPRRQDGKSGLLEAAQKMLLHINKHMFPVYEIFCEDADSICDALHSVPVSVLGFDLFDGDSFMEFREDSIWRLCLIPVYLYEYSQDDLWAYRGYAELRTTWKITHPAPPWALADWLEAHIDELDVKIKHSLGLVYFLRYLCNSTGHQFLDYTPQMLHHSDTQLDWTEEVIADLTEQWRVAAPYNKIMDAFTEWANEADHIHLVAQVIAAAGKAVMTGEVDDRWRLDGLEMAYNRLEGRVDADDDEIALAMGDWETVLDLVGDGSEELDDEEE